MMEFFNNVAEILKEHGSDFLKGMGSTLYVSLLSTILGLVIGLLVGIVRTIPVSENKVKRAIQKVIDFILSAYIEIFRGTPMMVQAMVIYWGFASVSSIDVMLPSVINTFAIIIVTINTGAYIAEIVRGGIMSIDKGQSEGAHAIGMGHFKTMFYVIIPQVIKNILPAVANEFVINIKDTSVLNVISFSELFFYAKITAKETFLTFEVYSIICVLYFIMTFTVTRILKLIEKKLAGKHNYVLNETPSETKEVEA